MITTTIASAIIFIGSAPVNAVDQATMTFGGTTEWHKSDALCFAVIRPPACDLDNNDPKCLSHLLGTCPGKASRPGSIIHSTFVGSFLATLEADHLFHPECDWATLSGGKMTAEQNAKCKAQGAEEVGPVFYDSFPAVGSMQSVMYGASTHSATDVDAMSVYQGLKTTINVAGEVTEAERLKQSPYAFATVEQKTSTVEKKAPINHNLCPDDSNKGPYPREQSCGPDTTLARGQLQQTYFSFLSGDQHTARMPHIRAVEGYDASGIRTKYEVFGNFKHDGANTWKINGRSVGEIVGGGEERIESIDVRAMSFQQPDGEGLWYTFPERVYTGQLESTGVTGEGGDPDQHALLSSRNSTTKVTARVHSVVMLDKSITFEMDVLVDNEDLVRKGAYMTYSPIVSAVAPPAIATGPGDADTPAQSTTAAASPQSSSTQGSKPRGKCAGAGSQVLVSVVATVMLVAASCALTGI